MLGLLLIVSGVLMIMNGFKDHLNAFKTLRTYLLGSPQIIDVLKASAEAASDTTLSGLVYLHAVMVILSGALVIANIRVGGLLMAVSMLGFIMTRDNPYLANSDAVWRVNFQNMLKDLAVAGAGLLLFAKKRRIVHRKGDHKRRDWIWIDYR